MRLLLYLAVAAAAFLGLSLMSFWLAVRPPRIAIPLAPGDFNLPARELTITAADGVRLAAWLIPRPGAPAIVLLHGYPAEKADLLPIAAALSPRFTTLLLDLRYFGRSGGHVTTLGVRERRDLVRTVDRLADLGLGPVGVFGFSLGGSVALLAAAEDPRIRAVAAWAPFADLTALGHELYAWMWVLRYPFVRAMLLWGRLFLGHDLATPSPADAARSLTVPVLLIHSRQDEQIPFGHAERLQRALAGNRAAEFHFPARGGHMEQPADLGERLTRFFEKRLGSPAD